MKRGIELVEMKWTARLSGKIEEYKYLCKKCKSQLKSDKQRWADEKAEAGETALSNGQLKDAFANFRQLRAATAAVSSPILDASGSLISDKQLKLKRWEDHFTQLLNRPPATPSLELQQAAAAAVEDPAISSAEPNEEEVAATLNKLKNGKVPGICNITPETLKAAGPAVVKWVTKLFHAVWSGNSVPEDWN